MGKVALGGGGGEARGPGSMVEVSGLGLDS